MVASRKNNAAGRAMLYAIFAIESYSFKRDANLSIISCKPRISPVEKYEYVFRVIMNSCPNVLCTF